MKNEYSKYSDMDISALVEGYVAGNLEYSFDDLKEVQTELVNRRMPSRYMGVISSLMRDMIETGRLDEKIPAKNSESEEGEDGETAGINLEPDVKPVTKAEKIQKAIKILADEDDEEEGVLEGGFEPQIEAKPVLASPIKPIIPRPITVPTENAPQIEIEETKDTIEEVILPTKIATKAGNNKKEIKVKPAPKLDKNKKAKLDNKYDYKVDNSFSENDNMENSDYPTLEFLVPFLKALAWVIIIGILAAYALVATTYFMDNLLAVLVLGGGAILLSCAALLICFAKAESIKWKLDLIKQIRR
jgi:hypothetical protein